MKRLIFFLFVSCTVRAADLPPASAILAAARAQLPSQPVELTGTLKERAANGFVKQSMDIKMHLDWSANPARATYRLTDRKNRTQTLEIQWLPSGPEYHYVKDGSPVESFDPNAEIDSLGVTWADLSFSFLWRGDAEVAGVGKKLGRDCFELIVPRSGGNRLTLWIEKETGRMLGAREESPNGKLIKDIKVVSVKEFDGLWMVKDIDIIRPQTGARASLRIDTVEMKTRADQK